jgi:hypothetical protein
MPRRIKDMVKEYYRVFNRQSGSFRQGKKESGFSVSHIPAPGRNPRPINHQKVQGISSSPLRLMKNPSPATGDMAPVPVNGMAHGMRKRSKINL